MRLRHLLDYPWTCGRLMTTWHRVYRSRSACARLVLGYHPLRLFDARRKRKEWRPLPPKPVAAVKGKTAAAAQSCACDLGRPVSLPIDTYNRELFIEQAGARVREEDSQVRSEKRAVIPAVTRMDGSARCANSGEKHTAVPVLLNTASNWRGEAIVDTSGDAHRTFFSFGIDAWVLRSFLVEK
ncbi:MAG TPA: carbamoyltransferase C-terminal domain-containing protein [Candidatus Acidoferrum sp.]